jgi:hypothetical protein
MKLSVIRPCLTAIVFGAALAVRGTFDYFQTRFDTNGVAPANPFLRQDEKAVLTRVQLVF